MGYELEYWREDDACLLLSNVSPEYRFPSTHSSHTDIVPCTHMLYRPHLHVVPPTCTARMWYVWTDKREHFRCANTLEAVAPKVFEKLTFTSFCMVDSSSVYQPGGILDGQQELPPLSPRDDTQPTDHDSAQILAPLKTG